MKNQKSRIFATALAVFAAFSSMLYISCNKDEGTSITGDVSCLEVLCMNGGACVDGICHCPTGYVGDSCQLTWAHRFVGSYTVSETIQWSSNATVIGQDSMYAARIRQSAVPEIFFVDSLTGNDKFNTITGIVDSTTLHFNFLQNEGVYYNKLVVNGGQGTINETGTTIMGYYKRQLKDSLGNVRVDSVTFSMSKKQ